MARRTVRGGASAGMQSIVEWPIAVRRQVRDGWYVYTCDKLPGLLVASEDDRAAFNDVPAVIQQLMKLDFDLDCTVVQKLPCAESAHELKAMAEHAVEAADERAKQALSGADGQIAFVVQYMARQPAHA